MKRIQAMIFFLVVLACGCESALETELTGKVILLAPADRTIMPDTTTVFYWETMNGASSYQLQVVSPQFDSVVRLIADTTLNNNRFSVILPRNNTYEWRVRALNSASASPYSDTFHLTIQ